MHFTKQHRYLMRGCIVFILIWSFAIQTSASNFESYSKLNAAGLLDYIYKTRSDTDQISPNHKAIVWMHYYNRVAQYYQVDSIGIALKKVIDKNEVSSANAEIMQLHARALMEIGFIDEAHKQYLRSYKIAIALKDTQHLIQAIIGLSKVYSSLNSFEMSTNHAARALIMAKKINNQHAIAEALNANGDLHFYLGEFALAQQFYEEASDNYFKAEDNVAYARALMQKSACLMQANKNDEAEEILNRVLFTFYNSQEYLLASQALFYLGELMFLNNKWNEAIYFYTLSMGNANKINAKELIMKSLMQLSECHAKLNQFDLAYTFQKEYQQNRDAVLNERIAQQINSLDAQFQNAQNQERIKNLLQEQKLLADNAELKQKQQIILYFTIGLLALTLILVWYTFRQRLSHEQILNRQSEQIHQQDMQELINKKEIETMNAIIETQETERKRIAADLHDHVGSLLASVKLQFKSMLEEVRKSYPALQDRIENVSGMLDNATNDIRRISHNLDSDVLNKFGLPDALKELCAHFKNATGMDVTFSGEYRKNALPNKAEMPLYRCVQELITNAIKHAEADTIEVSLNQLDDSVNLIVSDNGKGFDINKVDLTKSLGWRNMKSRIEHLKGKIHIDSNPISGTSVIIELPYESYD
jgi:two-component system NarL family sensor kinase